MSDDRMINSIRFTTVPKDADNVASLFRELRDASRKEPGVIEYQVARSPGKPNVFALWEVYRDQEALNAHLASEHFQRLFVKGVRPLLQEQSVEQVVPI
jgi:(4S)-4-hydroxy-5-phosphonooxypentane-2,3-dione isomerase